MKYKKTISLLSLFTAVLSLIGAAVGVFGNQGASRQFTSLHGEVVTLYGRGLYQNDSVSVAAQAIGQDIVTLLLAIPLLLVSLYLARKGHMMGRLLLAGTLGYFLYTYTSYTFYSQYHSLFLLDVALMSMSFFAFTLSMMSFDMAALPACFSDKLPVKTIGGLLIFIASALGLLWLKMIITPLIYHTVPMELEHYTTLTIQAMDLGLVIPVSILSGILLIKQNPFGYLLSTVMIIKETTLLSAITVMMLVQGAAGISVGNGVIAVFILFDLVILTCLFLMMRYVREPR